MSLNQLQHTVSDLMAQDDSSVADHLFLVKQLSVYTDKLPDYFRKIKAGFLSNFTLQGLPEVFKVRALSHNIWVDTYLGPYNQYTQEILNPESELYKFKPQLIYFLVDHIDSNENQVKELVESLSDKGFRVKLIWGSAIKEKFPDHWHTKYKELGDLRLAPQAFPDFVDQELIGEAVAASGATKKCLVTDLDNTLWRGIVGENELDEIEPDRDLQEHILDLRGRGVVLAVNSRNNYDDAMSVVDGHPSMVLRRNHFAALKINWQDKVANMAELAKELNLGLDSFVFVDDDPFQRAGVKNRFPEVAVLPPEKLESYSGFSSLTLTEEDKKRGQMYAEEKQRREAQVSLGNVEDFLRELNMEIVIKSANDSSIARIAQLTQKTNQFNLTTRRYSEQDINRFIKSGWQVWSVSAQDKFGDYGIIGVGIIEPKGLTWRIDTFLFSCRILGRAVERAFLAYITNQARAYDVQTIEGNFIPTAKNEPCKSFYDANGFDVVSSGDERKLYRYSIANNQELDYPGFLKVVSV